MVTTSKVQRITLHSDYSRRFPDPLNQNSESDLVYNLEHHILLCPALAIPAGLPKDPNPREQRIDHGIYKDVGKSLANADEPTFHLKNKGITILARSVEQSNDKKKVVVILGPGEGIVDGAHTYEIIRKAIEDGTCPDNQYVRIEVITGVPADMITDITQGLNTAVQVQDMAIANLAGEFDWIREILKGKPYLDRIAFKDNETDKQLDIRDLVSILTLFNIEMYPDSNIHPKKAITSKAECLRGYLQNKATYRKLEPILLDILQLHDYVHIRSREKYNENKRAQQSRGKAGSMKGVFNTRKRGNFTLPFTEIECDTKLHDGALYPMLAALRFCVVPDKKTGKFSWRAGGLDEVKALFDSVAPEMVVTTYNTSLIYGRKASSLPKDDNLWTTLYKTVALAYFEKHSN